METGNDGAEGFTQSSLEGGAMQEGTGRTTTTGVGGVGGMGSNPEGWYEALRRAGDVRIVMTSERPSPQIDEVCDIIKVWMGVDGAGM